MAYRWTERNESVTLVPRILLTIHVLRIFEDLNDFDVSILLLHCDSLSLTTLDVLGISDTLSVLGVGVDPMFGTEVCPIR